MGRSNLLGAWGEALAAEYLRKKRYKILAAGYRCRFGEIDLIAANRTYLVFVEVKLRKSPDFAGSGSRRPCTWLRTPQICAAALTSSKSTRRMA